MLDDLISGAVKADKIAKEGMNIPVVLNAGRVNDYRIIYAEAGSTRDELKKLRQIKSLDSLTRIYYDNKREIRSVNDYPQDKYSEREARRMKDFREKENLQRLVMGKFGELYGIQFNATD